MVRACCTHDHKRTVRHAHLKLVDQPPTKVRMLIPFPILLLYRTNWTTCSTLPLYVLVFPGLFIFFPLRTRPMLPKCFVIFVPLFCRLLPYEGTLMLPTPFEMLVRSPTLLVLPYAQAHADQNCQNMSLNYFCMSHVGSMLAKCASYCLHLSRTWSSV